MSRKLNPDAIPDWRLVADGKCVDVFEKRDGRITVSAVRSADESEETE
jgi:hypothetical protein